MALRVLTWNLKHGRAVPSAGRELFDEFAAALGGWEWDVALLQEVPPWWPGALAERLGVQQRLVLTSRNSLLALRRALARRWPDAIKSNGGGANAILITSAAAIEQHRVRRLALLPERRWVHAVLHQGIWLANLHTAASGSQVGLAAATVRQWAAGAPAVLGGDFNLRSPALDGFQSAGGEGVDHVFVSGLRADRAAQVLDRGVLSDHAPIIVSVG